MNDTNALLSRVFTDTRTIAITTMTSNQSLQDRKNAATSNGVGVLTQIFVDRARNAEVWDVEGRRYIDFAAGIAVLNTGHCHPKIVSALHSQLERFTHTAYQVLPYESYIALAEKLNASYRMRRKAQFRLNVDVCAFSSP